MEKYFKRLNINKYRLKLNILLDIIKYYCWEIITLICSIYKFRLLDFSVQPCSKSACRLNICGCLFIISDQGFFFFFSRHHSSNKSWPANYLCLFRPGSPPISARIAGSSSSLSHGSRQADFLFLNGTVHSMACSITAVCSQVSSGSACHQTHWRMPPSI